MWHGLSIIFNEIVLSNKFSFEPQHHLEDPYIPIFALIYTMELLRLPTYATDFFFKLWYDSIVKCILHDFSRKILAQAVKNEHDHIFILWQIKG